MKKIIIFLSVFCQFSVNAQNDSKRDYIWLFGYGGEGPSKDTFYSNIIIDFKEKKIEPKRLNILMDYNDDLAIISDTTGKLLFYTNGIYIADSTHQPMKNGEGLNPGQFAVDKKKKAT